MSVSFDRHHDGDDNEPVPDRAPRPAPGLDHAPDGHAAQAPDPRSRAELTAEDASLGHAIGELASENADLYKRVDALQAELKASQAETEIAQDKFRARAKVISNRDVERAVQDETRDKREEAFADRLAELERRDADRAAVADSGVVQPGISRQEVVRADNGQHKRRTGRPSNEIIAAGAAYVAIGLSIFGQVKGSPEAAALSTYGAEVANAVVAHIALYRKHKETGDGD